jgi:hypothetical protein
VEKRGGKERWKREVEKRDTDPRAVAYDVVHLGR